MTTLLDHFTGLDPDTRRDYAAMPAPKRAWALAKCAYEAASELSHAEQKLKLAELTAALQATDPEPVTDPMPPGFTRAQRHARYADWQAWHERHPELNAACEVIITKHKVLRLQELLRAAETLLVEWAAEQWQRREPKRWAGVATLFTRFAARDLPAEVRARFLENCFACPPEP